MAIVPDKSGNGSGSLMPNGVDQRFCTPSRTNAGDPNSVGPLTPAFLGERVWDSTNHKMWEAQQLTTAGWQEVLDTKQSGA